MFHFLQKKMIKKNRNKGTINVLQGGGGSAEYGQRPYFYKKKFGPFPYMVYLSKCCLDSTGHNLPEFQTPKQMLG